MDPDKFGRFSDARFVEPDTPYVRCANFDVFRNRAIDAGDISRQLLGWQVGTQDHFVANKNTVDHFGVFVNHVYGERDFPFIERFIRTEPDAKRNSQPQSLCFSRDNIKAAINGICANAFGIMRQVFEIFSDSLPRHGIKLRLGINLARAVRHPVQLARPVWGRQWTIQSQPKPRAGENNDNKR